MNTAVDFDPDIHIKVGEFSCFLPPSDMEPRDFNFLIYAPKEYEEPEFYLSSSASIYIPHEKYSIMRGHGLITSMILETAQSNGFALFLSDREIGESFMRFHKDKPYEIKMHSGRYFHKIYEFFLYESHGSNVIEWLMERFGSKKITPKPSPYDNLEI